MYLKLLDTQKKKWKESVQDETGFILSKKIKQVLFLPLILKNPCCI